MNFRKYVVIVLGLCSLLSVFVSYDAEGSEMSFYRVVGPGASGITGITVAGMITWTNVTIGGTCTVQVATSLAGPVDWQDYVQTPVTNYVCTQRLFDLQAPSGMAFIPAGSFQMGESLGDGYSWELPVHSVYVSAFYMDRTEVTKALWDEVYAWAITNGYSFDSGAQGKAANHPAHSITWYDAAKWCNARSEKEGRTQAYYTDSGLTQPYRSGQVAPYVNWSSGYRLPTEAEWEKAARGGASGRRFPWADVDTITHSRANYYSDSSFSYDVSSNRGYHPMYNDGVYPYTSPVGSFAANGYGLYDMAGNVWEWCWDWYDYAYYSSSPGTDPRGPSSGLYRVKRGGGSLNLANHCRTAYRYDDFPGGRDYYFGFRAVLPPGQ